MLTRQHLQVAAACCEAHLGAGHDVTLALWHEYQRRWADERVETETEDEGET